MPCSCRSSRRLARSFLQMTSSVHGRVRSFGASERVEAHAATLQRAHCRQSALRWLVALPLTAYLRGPARASNSRELGTLSSVVGMIGPSTRRPPCPDRRCFPSQLETERQEVRLADDEWNSRDPSPVALAHTPDSHWRNRSLCLEGREAIEQLLAELGFQVAAKHPLARRADGKPGC